MNKNIERILALPINDECILWDRAISHNGYGVASIGKKSYPVHRLSLALHTGECRPGQHAAHSCRNRHCFNPRHLAWKTPSRNELDKRRDGTSLAGERNHNAKLTRQQVLAIRSDPRPSRQIAPEYGITHGTVCRVKKGDTWNE